MCTNRALVDSLECYMDDLVDSFEDFVKKSLIVISVAIGILVIMIAYVMKIVSDRTRPASTAGTITQRNSLSYGNRNALGNNVLVNDSKDHKGTCTSPLCPDNKDEEVLKNTRYSGSKTKIKCPSSGTRLSIPSLRTECKICSAKAKAAKTKKIEANLGSCCSMCCDDNDEDR